MEAKNKREFFLLEAAAFLKTGCNYSEDKIDVQTTTDVLL